MMGITESIKRCVGFAIFMAIGLAWARPASSIEYDVNYPTDQSDRIFLPPGGVGTLSFDVKNNDLVAGTATVKLLNALNGGFSLELLQPGPCGAPPLSPSSIYIAVELAAGESRRCTYRLTRALASTRDGVLGLCTGVQIQPSPCEWDSPAVKPIYAGFNPDVAISTERISPSVLGDLESMVRVTVRNASALGTRDIFAYSQCRQFNEQYPYTLDNQIAGGCPLVHQQVGCELAGFGIPPPVYRWVVKIAPVAPMGEASCMVRLRFPNPLSSSFTDTLSLDGDRFQRFTLIPLDLGNNYFGVDPNPANDNAVLGAILPPTVVSIGNQVTWIFLSGMLVGIAWRRRTRVRSTLRGR